MIAVEHGSHLVSSSLLARPMLIVDRAGAAGIDATYGRENDQRAGVTWQMTYMMHIMSHFNWCSSLVDQVSISFVFKS